MTETVQIIILSLGIAILSLATGTFIVFAIFNRYSSSDEERSIFDVSTLLQSRKKEIFHLADRIRSGQSSTLIGFFSEERTDILGFLRNENPKQRRGLYGDEADKLLFSYLDFGFLEKNYTLTDFWESVLAPLQRKMSANSEFQKAYEECQANGFKKIYLENLISLANQQGWRLVLLLDRFDELLAYPNFKDNWEFFTTLRYLAASRTPSPLVLVISSYLSLEEFHEKIQYQNPSASPVLGFIEGISILRGLSEQEVDNLLKHNQFSRSPKQAFIKKMVGGHPYLLQRIVSELWQGHLTQKPDVFDETTAEEFFYQQIKTTLERMISGWSPSMCQAFLAIANQQPVNEEYKQGLQVLETQGIITGINEQRQIRAHIFLKSLNNIRAQCSLKDNEDIH